MFGDEPDGDYTCGGCGRGYYADVNQWGCPYCGSHKLPGDSMKPVKVSPESYAESMLEFAITYDSPDLLLKDDLLDLDIAKKLLDEKIEKLNQFRENL